MNQDNNFIMFRGPTGLKCGPHINSELEIIVVTCGTIDITLGDCIITAHEGDAVFILPYETHAFSPHEGTLGRVYMFSFGIVEDFYNNHGGKSIDSGKFQIPEQMRHYLAYATECAEETPNEFAAKSLFFPLVSEYLRTRTAIVRQNKPHALSVRRIVDYVHNNLSEKITLKSLSQALGINPSALSSTVKEYTGIPFSDFVNNLKLEKAVHLLHDCDISITEAAYLSGFGSIRNFNRIFFDTLGLTPSEYKKQKKS